MQLLNNKLMAIQHFLQPINFEGLTYAQSDARIFMFEKNKITKKLLEDYKAVSTDEEIETEDDDLKKAISNLFVFCDKRKEELDKILSQLIQEEVEWHQSNLSGIQRMKFINYAQKYALFKKRRRDFLEFASNSCGVFE